MTLNANQTVLLVDDDPSMLRLLSIRLESVGYQVISARSGEEALPLLRQHTVGAVVTDLRMDGMDGMALFGRIRHFYPSLPVIILSAQGTIPEAVDAAQQGVFEFLTKPVDKDKLLEALQSAFRQGGMSHGSDKPSWRNRIICKSDVMMNLLNQVEQISSMDVAVLINGASGTGKELLARAIHDASGREGNFVPINCGALPEQLLESELFGHIKGAFTGAVKAHKGLFQAAEKGTLFLDEIGDMPLALQVKLLRALQDQCVRPVGSTSEVPVNVRVISATHRDLRQAMTEGVFREDLFYRLNVINLNLPPLKDRPEDIGLLVVEFLRKIDPQGERVSSFSPAAMSLLASVTWPGNVRQLENLVQQVVALSPSKVVSMDLVRQLLSGEGHYFPSLQEVKEQCEYEYLTKVLQITNGSVSDAAQLAQRNRTDFYKLLKRHNLKPLAFKPATA